MMFVGYPANREEDSVRMWNQITNGVVTTRDVIWMKQMFFEKASSSEWISDEKIVHKTEAKDSNSIASAKDEESGDEQPVIWYLEESDDESEAGQTIDHAASDSRQLRDRSAIRVPQQWTYETMAAMTEGMRGTAAELRYLGNMCKADNCELVATSITSHNLELSQVRV